MLWLSARLPLQHDCLQNQALYFRHYGCNATLFWNRRVFIKASFDPPADYWPHWVSPKQANLRGSWAFQAKETEVSHSADEETAWCQNLLPVHHPPKIIFARSGAQHLGRKFACFDQEPRPRGLDFHFKQPDAYCCCDPKQFLDYPSPSVWDQLDPGLLAQFTWALYP